MVHGIISRFLLLHGYDSSIFIPGEKLSFLASLLHVEKVKVAGRSGLSHIKITRILISPTHTFIHVIKTDLETPADQ